MAIPAGRIITVGALNVIDRLQDAGLQNPRVPTETIRETGNDLVVGKVLTEADFSFQLVSWDVSCDMMAMLTGKLGSEAEGPSAKAAAGTAYKWSDCQFVNLACPWAHDSTTEGGHISSGVIIPAFYPSALSYKFGVTSNAEQTVTLNGGAYYMAGPGGANHTEAFPIEEFAEAKGVEGKPVKELTVETKEIARVHRIGGAESEKYRHVFGVLVNGVIQQEEVDYKEEGGAKPGEASKVVKIKFIREVPDKAIIRFCYFSDKPGHALGEGVHASTTVTPAAVRGRNIEVLIGPEGEQQLLRGVQAFDLNATHAGQVQREMGTYDPIGYNETGIDCNGTVSVDPKEESALYDALETLTGVSKDEVFGYINEHPVLVEIKIFNPRSPSEVLKSLKIGDGLLQAPGTSAKVNSVTPIPLAFESENGSFEEVKGE